MQSTPEGGGGSRRHGGSHKRTVARGKSTQTAAARARDRCALALQAGGLAAFEWSVRTDTLTGSEGFAALAGLDAASGPQSLASWLSRVHEADRASLEREMRSAVAAGRSLRVEFRVTTGDSSVRWIRVRADVFRDGDGDVASLIGLVDDVTERRSHDAEHAGVVRRERQLRAAAERANRAKDEFLSMFSHELRSPLNAILGWNRILAVKRAQDAEVVAMTARIERSAKAQLKMVDDLLDLGRINAGKLKIEPRPIELASVVAAALEASRPAASAKGVELRSAVATAESHVYGDPERLQQVVWNLLSNAIKFTDTGGRVQVALRAARGQVELDVLDSGQGIPTELLPHVFDRFRQGDSSTTRQGSGLGLGLAVVREIIALHGGTVSAVSDGPGRGSAFIVRLPALHARRDVPDGSDRKDGQGAPQPRGMPRRPLAGLSILVVDDEPDARAMVAETLRLEGARVTQSESAAAALVALGSRDAHYDVVVTDIGMPTEDGYSLVRKLRGTPFGDRVIAVALTGYASQRDRDDALRAGFDVHVSKPVDFDHFVPLIARMTRALRRAHEH
jgi:signal transduction histidine kinase/CheY-like chemotaxis protein